MIRTIYTCDRCKAEQDTSNQLWHVGISLKYYNQTRTERSAHHEQLWCRQCCANVGIAFVPERQLSTTPAEPTLEDMIREIIRQEIPAAIAVDS